MKKLNLFWRMIRDILWYSKQFKYKVEIISNNPNPDNLKKNIVYVVGEKEYFKWAYLKCPCGCKNIIMLSLNAKKNPNWSINQDKKGRATIFPSIHKLDGCYSHFWIKNGLIYWV